MAVARPGEMDRADSRSSVTSSRRKPLRPHAVSDVDFSSVKANAASTLRRSALTSPQRGNRGELLVKPRRLVSEVKGSLELEVWKFETSQKGVGSTDTHQLCALRLMVWMLDAKGCLGSPIYTQILYIRTSIYFTSLA